MTQNAPRSKRPTHTIALSIAVGSCCLSAPALADTTAGVNISAAGSVATNPFQQTNPKTAGSITSNVSPWVRLEDETDMLELRANLGFNVYAREYSDDFSASAYANGHTQLSPYVILNGAASYQTTRRPLDALLTGQNGEPPLPTEPLPDVSFGGTQGRSELFDGNVAFNITASERGSVTLGMGVAAARFDDFNTNEYNTYSGSAGYSHRLSERTTLNAYVNFSQSDYTHKRLGDGTTITPRIGISRQLNATLGLSLSGGMSITRTHVADGSVSKFTSFSGDFSLCNTNDRSKMCLTAGQSAQPTAFGGISNATNVSLLINEQVGRRTNVSVVGQYSKSSESSLLPGRKFETYGGSATLSRDFGRRLSGFVTPSYTKFDDHLVYRKTNFQVQVGLRFNLGAMS